MRRLLKISLIVVLSGLIVFYAYMYKQANTQFESLVDKANEMKNIVEDNDEQISNLSIEIDNTKKEKELLIKEYDVWMHQNQKLVELLQQ